jgi:hypothetical protein
MLLSAKSGISEIIKMEPKIEDGSDKLTVSLQPDNVATDSGDIRDVLIIRRSIEWEIGVSVKHNHAALKHSRLSTKLDFGKVWFNVSCSENYFNEIKPIFDRLKLLKSDGVEWNQLPDKDDSVYVPILNAFRSELMRMNNENTDITTGLVSYLLGSNGKDYYKLIHKNNHTITVIPFNIYGTLNQSSAAVKPKIIISTIELPTRIIEFVFKKDSKTTVILTMDNGWSISFRIHNASTIVEPSLKFDVQLIGQPANLFYLEVGW